jgi:DNA-binding transcriptional LysR family regulator
MNLSLREINYVLTVFSEGSITKAAQVLHIAQPSLSQSIQKIERTLGAQLFSRSGNNVKITYAGECFVKAGLKIQKISRDLENELQHISNLDAGRILLGIPFYLGSYMLPRISKIYEELHPNIIIKLTERPSSELESMVISGAVDLALMPLTAQLDGLIYDILFEARIVLSIPAGHWLNEHIFYKEGKKLPYVDIRLAANEHFLTGQPGQRIRQGAEYIFQKAGINPPIVFESRSIETIKRLSASGMGLAFIPDYYMDFINISQDAVYCYVEDEFNPDWKVAVVLQSQAEPTSAVKEFIRIAREIFGT